MKKALLIIVFLLPVICSFSQKNWESKFNGYVLTPDSAIIKGYLKVDVGSVEKGKRIKVHKTPGDKPQEFYALELSGYAVRKDTFEIIPNTSPGRSQKQKIAAPLVEALVASRGKLILYEIEEAVYDPLFNPMFDAAKLKARNYIKYVYEIMDSTGELIHSEAEDFGHRLRLLLIEAPDLASKIKDKRPFLGKDTKDNELIKVIKEYNARFKK